MYNYAEQVVIATLLYGITVSYPHRLYHRRVPTSVPFIPTPLLSHCHLQRDQFTVTSSALQKCPLHPGVLLAITVLPLTGSIGATLSPSHFHQSTKA